MNFQDQWSRWHHKPIPEGHKYSSGNGWIYTAEAMAVGLPVDEQKLRTAILLCHTEYGYTRHPDVENPGISHDEMFGISYLQGLYYPHLAKKQVNKWESQRWQICDIAGFKPTPWYKLNWPKVIHSFYKIYKLDKEYTKTNKASGKKARHATYDYPVVFPIAYHIGGWKRYLIKRHLGVSPSLYENLAFLVAKLFTIYGSKEWTPGKRILGFQLKLLKNKTIVDQIIDKCYKSKYDLRDIAQQEYHKDHPILEKLLYK
jgi:hypothetical protein